MVFLKLYFNQHLKASHSMIPKFDDFIAYTRPLAYVLIYQLFPPKKALRFSYPASLFIEVSPRALLPPSR